MCSAGIYGLLLGELGQDTAAQVLPTPAEQAAIVASEKETHNNVYRDTKEAHGLLYHVENSFIKEIKDYRTLPFNEKQIFCFEMEEMLKQRCSTLRSDFERHLRIHTVQGRRPGRIRALLKTRVKLTFNHHLLQSFRREFTDTLES